MLQKRFPILTLTSLIVAGKGILQQAQALNTGTQCNVNIDNPMPRVDDKDRDEYHSGSWLPCPFGIKAFKISI